jgi:hypothetical protein
VAEIATGNEAIAIKLTEYVKWHVPTGWVGPISEFAFSPMFMEKDIKGGLILSKYPWYVREAIESFIKKEKYNVRLSWE